MTDLDTLRPEVTDDWPATLGEYLKVMSTLEQRFTSGNEVPVPDARITRAEWEVLDRFSLADEARSTDAGMEILRLNDKCDDLKAEIAEMKQSFDLRWKADMRAIDHWRREHPGNDLTWPDHADLCVWLMGELAALKARIADGWL